MCVVGWAAAQVGSRNKVEEVREVLYLLAVGYFRSQDYERSRSLCTKVLEVSGLVFLYLSPLYFFFIIFFHFFFPPFNSFFLSFFIYLFTLDLSFV